MAQPSIVIFLYAISLLNLGSAYLYFFLTDYLSSILLAALDKQSDQEYVSWQNEQLKVGKQRVLNDL
jgi:hypothetical protein